MHVLRTLLALLALMALSFSSVGQDTGAPEDEATPAEATPAEATPAEAPPAPPDTRPLDEIFIPSEEIAADEEVIFPVNI
ncbi:MAG: hypothetical protein V3S67_02730 [Gammaproteobacteria bacterium]